MGAEIDIEHGYIHAKAKRLSGAHIVMDIITVTGTENLMMAATLADGTTVIENAAREAGNIGFGKLPYRDGRKNFLGVGSDIITIEGVETLHGATYRVMADRIETGTFLVAAAASGGEIHSKGTRTDTLDAVLDKLMRSRCGNRIRGNGLDHLQNEQFPQVVSICGPHLIPLFPLICKRNSWY